MKFKMGISVCIMIFLWGFGLFFLNTLTDQANMTLNKQLQPKSATVQTKKPIHQNIDYSQAGFELMNQESLGFIKINVMDIDLIKHYGEPEVKLEPQVWGADDLEHQTWLYRTKGIELDMVREEANQVVNMITIKNPCELSTSRKIGIGSTKTDVIAAYRNEIDPEENDLTSDQIAAGTIYGGIIFYFEKDRVSSIFIGVAAE